MLKAIPEKFYRYAVMMVLVAIAALIVLTFRDYGITWDEELQSQYGLAVIDYYLSGFQDNRYAEIFNLYLYGGMFDGLAAIVDRFTPFKIYETRHLLNAIFGLLGMWGTWKLGRFIGGGPVGLLAVLLLTLTPMFYGHMFNNPKDIPFATGIVWTLYFMARAMAEMPQPKMGVLIKLSLIFGLTLGIRVGGMMALFFWVSAIALSYTALPVVRWKDILLPIGKIVGLVFICSYLVMLVCWPWAQQNPILNPLRALGEFSNFPQNVEVLLDGVIYMSTELPWFYVPQYFVVQLPEILLLFLGLGFISLPWLWRRLAMPQRQALVLLMMMAFVPMLYALVHRPALYDAVRHFLFAVPLMCILAALGGCHVFVWAVNEFRQNWSRQAVGNGMMAFLSIAIGAQVAVMQQLHPYEYIYANQLTGGVPGAFGRYELDYWGSSFKEAAEQLQAHVDKEGGVPAGKIYRVAICGPWDSAMIYLPPNYQAVVASEPAEFFLSTTRWMCQDMRAGKTIIEVGRMGVPLSVVKDLRP